MTVQTTPPQPTHPAHKLNVGNISAVTDPILTKLYESNYLQALDFVWTKILFDPNFFEPKNYLDPKLFGP